MSKKTIEYAASVIKEIKAEVKDEVIKDYHISKLCNIETGRDTGFAVCFTLRTKFDYPSSVLENWRKRLYAEDYFISVRQNQLRIRFNVMYPKK